MELMRRRMMMQRAESGGLPSGYQQVEYIQTSGQQHVKTDYSIVQNDEIDCICMATSASGDGSKAIWSAGTGTYQSIALLSNNRTLYFKNFASGNAPRLDLTSASNINNIKIRYYTNSGVLTVYNVTSDALIGTVTSQYEEPIDGTNKLYIFQRANESNSHFRGNLYSFKITNNGTTKMDLIPCYRISDSVVGMYDTVSQTFLTNAGSGTFSKGNDII